MLERVPLEELSSEVLGAIVKQNTVMLDVLNNLTPGAAEGFFANLRPSCVRCRRTLKPNRLGVDIVDGVMNPRWTCPKRSCGTVTRGDGLSVAKLTLFYQTQRELSLGILESRAAPLLEPTRGG